MPESVRKHEFVFAAYDFSINLINEIDTEFFFVFLVQHLLLSLPWCHFPVFSFF